jgi:hypothetical protein
VKRKRPAKLTAWPPFNTNEPKVAVAVVELCPGLTGEIMDDGVLEALRS